MAEPTGLKCVRCGKAFALSAHARGCDACLAQGVSANLTVAYDTFLALTPAQLHPAERSMWRYAPLLHAPLEAAI